MGIQGSQVLTIAVGVTVGLLLAGLLARALG